MYTPIDNNFSLIVENNEKSERLSRRKRFMYWCLENAPNRTLPTHRMFEMVLEQEKIDTYNSKARSNFRKSYDRTITGKIGPIRSVYFPGRNVSSHIPIGFALHSFLSRWRMWGRLLTKSPPQNIIYCIDEFHVVMFMEENKQPVLNIGFSYLYDANNISPSFYTLEDRLTLHDVKDYVIFKGNTFMQGSRSKLVPMPELTYTYELKPLEVESNLLGVKVRVLSKPRRSRLDPRRKENEAEPNEKFSNDQPNWDDDIPF